MAMQNIFYPGKEVIIVNPNHPQHDALGVTVGPADHMERTQIRALIDGEMYIYDAADLVEN